MTLPVLSLTLAIFLSPELGFLGFVVPTFKHTPFSSGLSLSCGDRSFRAFRWARPPRRTCINVHLCARDAGVHCAGRADVTFGKAVVMMDGRIDRAAVQGDVAKREGRMRRRRNVIGMAGGGLV